jgi:hypothetical protein
MLEVQYITVRLRNEQEIMKADQLKQMLQRLDDDTDIMIAIKLPFSTVGAIPMVPVKHAWKGFDWESGKFIITPEEELTPADRDFASQMKKMQDELGWAKYENRNLKAEIKKLRKQNGVEE